MRILSIFVLAGLFAVATATGALADNGGTMHFGPFAGTSPDGGTCGAAWATDAFNRVFTVHDNGDGTFRVTEDFRDGTFITIGPASPGRCETSGHHGTLLNPAVNGNFRGFLAGTVASTTFTLAACDTAGACSTTAGFVAAVFGSGAAFVVATFNFEYDSNDQTLEYHHWQDKSSPTGEQFIGDIANQ